MSDEALRKSKRAVFFLLKFCERREYAEDFIRGRLYLNTFDCFKELESTKGDGRADKEEAPILWILPKRMVNVVIKVGDKELSLPPVAFCGPPRARVKWSSPQHLLCLYAAHTGDLPVPQTPDEIRQLEEFLRVPAECSEMGKFAVLIQVGGFLVRLQRAVRRRGWGLEHDLVNYFDPESYSGHFDRPAFWKRNSYAWQPEFRAIIDTGTTENGPVVLDIGDLSDICSLIDLTRESFNEVFSPSAHFRGDGPSHERAAKVSGAPKGKGSGRAK